MMIKELNFALEVVRQSAELASQILKETVLSPFTKSDLSPVTSADFAIQALVGYRLGRYFPQDLLVAEETSTSLRVPEGKAKLNVVTRFVERFVPGIQPEEVCDSIDRGTAETGRRFWTLDPIDGTKGFLRGDQFVVALALIEEGEIKVGLIACPKMALGQGSATPLKGLFDGGSLAYAVRGQGAWVIPLKGEAPPVRLHVSGLTDPARAGVLASYEASHTNLDLVESLMKTMGLRREPWRMDSQVKYASLAAGAAEIFVRPASKSHPSAAKIWDHAAGVVLVEEAGGRVTDLNGEKLDFTAGRTLARNCGVLASNGYFHDLALEGFQELQKTGTGN